MLDLGLERELNVMVFGYDEFSGTRKLFVSKNYQSKDIEIGIFENFTLNIKNKEDKNATDNKN